MADLISRQAAIEAVNEREWLTRDAKDILTEVIEQLPSADLYADGFADGYKEHASREVVRIMTGHDGGGA